MALRTHHGLIALLLTVSVLAPPSGPAWAGPPTEQLRVQMDRVIKVLEEIFDFNETERIQFAGDGIEGDRATVRTRLVTKAGTEIPVDYRMHRVLVSKLTEKQEQGLEADREPPIRHTSQTK
jgi:hypothetical protein